MNCTILQGDALELLRTLPPESVHTCVTSPPYYNLRDYGVEGQIGKRQDREDILYRLRLIEACINKTDKRTLRIWKQLQQLLHLESEETE